MSKWRDMANKKNAKYGPLTIEKKQRIERERAERKAKELKELVDREQKQIESDLNFLMKKILERVAAKARKGKYSFVSYIGRGNNGYPYPSGEYSDSYIIYQVYSYLLIIYYRPEHTVGEKGRRQQRLDERLRVEGIRMRRTTVSKRYLNDDTDQPHYVKYEAVEFSW